MDRVRWRVRHECALYASLRMDREGWASARHPGAVAGLKPDLRHLEFPYIITCIPNHAPMKHTTSTDLRKSLSAMMDRVTEDHEPARDIPSSARAPLGAESQRHREGPLVFRT